ncbi:MAG: hypothetical protein J7L15_05015 [Clostridiales bacterium]|nr:hypothetical protein [Clostridiales bacterium]
MFGYCVAIGNEGGGRLILGVRDKINPDTGRRDVVGTTAIQNITDAKATIFNLLGSRIDIEEIETSDDLVQVIYIPSRPIARAFNFYGIYLMRNGEELRDMDQETLKKILNEVEPDFAQQIVKGVEVDDLDEEAIKIFCGLWAKKSKREDYLSFSNDKILRSIGILTNEGLCYAGLVLFGTEELLNKFLPDAEIIYEWRQDSSKTNYDSRKIWKAGFFGVYEDVWKVINDRNIRFPFQEGLIQREIFAFSEKPIREAILNAVAHRNYYIKGQSIFIKASSENFQIESPGAFPDGVTTDNILNKTFWRNRIIAETFEKAGLVERSGQGVDDIFNITISEGKGSPSYALSGSESVVLNIPAQVKDGQFVLFLEKIANQKQVTFSSEELLELEKIRENNNQSKIIFKDKFIGLGIVEKIGKTSDAKYVLSHEYYEYEKHPGIYTRIVGLNRDKIKELIINHLKKNKGGKLTDFKEAFPELKPMDISNILRDLRGENKIKFKGRGVKGEWTICDDCE